MASNKNGFGISVGLLTFLVVKVMLNKIGIENISIPIIIGLLAVSYIMFVVGVDKKKLTVKEKKYFIICASLLAVAFASIIVGIVFIKYFSDQVIGYKKILSVILIISMVSFIGAGLVAVMVKRDKN